jgi:adenylylsulfate kinase-like enzyme
VIVIASFISPYAEDRLQASEIIGKKSFVEVHVSASVKECMQRDVKGLYKKAMEGKISDFTGVNSPYEPPVNPSILIETGSATIHESLGQITTWIAENLLVTDLREIH